MFIIPDMMQAVNSAEEVRVLDHPVAAAHLSNLRTQDTLPNEFRESMRRLALFLLIEASRRWETRVTTMESPLGSFPGTSLARSIALIPILRAGLGLQEGMTALIPEASIGHIGLYRDPLTLRPVKYFSRLPSNLLGFEVLVLDPMLATGQSAVEAVSIVKAAGATRIQLICILASPAGLAEMQRAHPDVPIVTAAIDPELNASGYIVPGLGDAGDRYFGTD